MMEHVAIFSVVNDQSANPGTILLLPDWTCSWNVLRAHLVSINTMAKVVIVHVMLMSAHMCIAYYDAMYEAYTVRPLDFVITEEVDHLTSDFMCSIAAGKTDHQAFRINGRTGACELGYLTNDAEQGGNSNGAILQALFGGFFCLF